MTLQETELYRVFSTEGEFINPTVSIRDNLPYFISYDTSLKRLFIRKIKNEDTNIYRIDQSDLTVDALTNYVDPYCYNRDSIEEISIDIENFTEIDYLFIDDTIILSYIIDSNLYVATYDINGIRISNVLISSYALKPSLSYLPSTTTLYLFYFKTNVTRIMTSNSITTLGLTWSIPIPLKQLTTTIQSLSSVIGEINSTNIAFITYKDSLTVKVSMYFL